MEAWSGSWDIDDFSWLSRAVAEPCARLQPLSTEQASIRKETMEINPPVTKLKAPQATWAVAMSADRPVQMVAAPNSAWVRTNPSQNKVNRASTCLEPKRC